MVYRVSFRRLLLLAAFVTFTTFLISVWPSSSFHSTNFISHKTLKELLIKENSIEEDTNNDLAGDYLFGAKSTRIVESSTPTTIQRQPPTQAHNAHTEPSKTKADPQAKHSKDNTAASTPSTETPATPSTALPQVTQIGAPPSDKLWFFKSGTVRPTKQSSSGRLKIWPHEAPESDRIVNQLMYIPASYNSSHMKSIAIPNGLGSWGVSTGTSVFAQCPVSACSVTSDLVNIEKADAVLFKDFVSVDYKREPKSKQIWIIYELESPFHSSMNSLIPHEDEINWTATYRTDSDLVTPYEKWVYYNESRKTNPRNRIINFAEGKTHKVAWFVSNCHARNERLEYAKELSKFISVDIYGSCGILECPRSSNCFDLLDIKYKFYLSFENSNCNDYITEKFFVNGLSHNILPIVMGAPKSDYLRSAPLHSFIHVEDFKSPHQLADYLNVLDHNDTLYNEYFQWKGTGEFINTYFWCRLCTMVHDGGSAVAGKYSDVARWWREDECGANITKRAWGLEKQSGEKNQTVER